MTCRLCKWICDRLCPPGLDGDKYWDAASKWEQEYSHNWEPNQRDKNLRSRERKAFELVESDPTLALQQFVELADEGSAYAMRWAGYFYSGNLGIEKRVDLAEDYYRRALCVGSWLATINYANALYRRGAHDLWPKTLADGIDAGFIPAYFWYGWNSYRLRPSSKAAMEARPFLVRAAEAGHPGANALLARWTLMGRFGLSKIPEGYRMLRAIGRAHLTATSSGNPTAMR